MFFAESPLTIFTTYTHDEVLVTIKDIFYVFEGSELSNGFPGIAHHVVDDLWLYGVTVFTYFQLWLVLEVKTGNTKHDSQPNYKAVSVLSL